MHISAQGDSGEAAAAGAENLASVVKSQMIGSVKGYLILSLKI